MREIVVYFETELVRELVQPLLGKVPKCWTITVIDDVGWPDFVKLANDMGWYEGVDEKSKRVFDCVPINTKQGTLFVYGWQDWMVGTAIGNCSGNAYVVGVFDDDTNKRIVNRIVHELLHGVDKNGRCNPDCMSKVDPNWWLKPWQVKVFRKTNNVGKMVEGFTQDSFRYWLFWHIGFMFLDYWQGLFYKYLVEKYERGECNEGVSE